MGTINSLGLLEVRGLVAGIEAADAMLKSARVRLLRQHQVSPGLITLVVEGDLAACRASVDAGVAAAGRIGEILSQCVIGAPDGDTDDFVLELAGRGVLPFAVPSGAEKAPRSSAMEKYAAHAPVAAEAEPPIETPGPAEGKAEAPRPLPPETAAASLADLIDFLSRAARGFTWRELGERFPDLPPAMRGELDRAVKEGRLGKTGGRYRTVRDNEPASSATRKKRTK
jgi:ethanolamine utilization protein EutK